MKRTFTLLLLLFCHIVLCQSKSQDSEIRKTIDVFFEGLHARDTIKMQTVCEKDIILHSIDESAFTVKVLKGVPKEFYASIASIPKDAKFEEKQLGYEEKIDGTMAQVWVTYELYIEGKFIHKGVDAFTLFNNHGKWKIIYLIDTRRK